MDLITDNEKRHLAAGTVKNSWISVTCDAVGSKDDMAGPPADAVAAVKAMLTEMIGMLPEDHPAPKKTKVDARLLEA